MTTTNKIFLTLGFAVLTSCKSYDIKPGSERIRVFETEPKGCIFLGEIPTEQEDKVTGPAPIETEMSLPTRVELRNKAFALNANVIVFASKHKKAGASALPPTAADAKKAPAAPAATPTPPTPNSNEAESERKIMTVFLATVFRCPPNIVNQ